MHLSLKFVPLQLVFDKKQEILPKKEYDRRNCI